jgi:N-acyl-D-aspartate/D-glutamate deacylase
VEVVLDLLVERDGNQLLYMPLFNYAQATSTTCARCCWRPTRSSALSDAGAHCGAISDGSMTTTALALWTRDRTAGPPAADRADGAPHHAARRQPRGSGTIAACSHPATWPTST